MENKIMHVIINAPAESYSLYGIKSRELIKTIKSIHSDWNIEVYNYNEDDVRNGYKDEEIKSLITAPVNNILPDVWIYVGNPAGFYRRGKKNIGVVMSRDFNPIVSFINKCNEMDLILTYSEYSKNSILELAYNSDNNNIKINTPIIVLPEYSILSENNFDNKEETFDLLKDVKTEWNFLCDGYWEITDEVEFGGKNKDNIGFIIRNFLAAFTDTDINIGLILCVHGKVASILDETRLMKRINDICDEKEFEGKRPKIYLINNDLTQEERFNLYNDPRVCVLVSIPQRSDSAQMELDFAITSGKPIMYSNYGAQKEVLNYPGNMEINGNLKRNGTEPIIIDTFASELKLGLYDIYHHYQKLLFSSNINSSLITNIFNKDNYREVVNNIINELIKEQ